jgi:hypothetical protein
MTTDTRSHPEKRPPPRLDLTGPEWKLLVTGALGLAWAVAWLALAKPQQGPAAITDAAAAPIQAPPRVAGAPPRLAAAGAPPRLAAAAPTRSPRPAAIRIRTRAS